MQWLVLIDAQAALIRVQGGRTLLLHTVCNVFFGPMATDFADFSVARIVLRRRGHFLPTSSQFPRQPIGIYAIVAAT